jgi:hypothetical protein
MLPVVLPNTKPNNGRFQNQVPEVSLLIQLAASQAGGWAEP